MELFQPNEVSFREIERLKSLSPKNYARVDIYNKNKVPLSIFLDSQNPYSKGIEPGAFTYVDKSTVKFTRNSCINETSMINIPQKNICLNPNYGFTNQLQEYDILLCKDANIGQSCLFIPQPKTISCFSSGIVKLNIKEECLKFFILAFIRDNYFQTQLDLATPRGSTIRHAGDRFLDCLIPSPSMLTSDQLELFEILIKNIAHAELESENKVQKSCEIFDKELYNQNYKYKEPNISSLESIGRIDAGYFSEEVSQLFYNVLNLKSGYKTLHDFGFTIKRGPNLAKRDLGRSIKRDIYKANYHLLVYPSDISDSGYITKKVYLGARNEVWYLKNGDILFSAEGSIGKTFAICSEELKFTTNFHGIIITPKTRKTPLSNSIFLTLYLIYLRRKGILDKISVGGQGGSFAVGYWENFKIPVFTSKVNDEMEALYHSKMELNPFTFSLSNIKKAGIFELNTFRILCEDILKMIIVDIKASSMKEISLYKKILEKKK